MKVKCERCGRKTKPFAGLNLTQLGNKYSVGIYLTDKDREVVLCKQCVNDIIFRTVFQYWKDSGQPIIIKENENEDNQH